MNSQTNSLSNGTAPARNGKGIHKKKRKRKFFQINDNAMNSPTKHTAATTEGHDDVSQPLQPKKKRRFKKKKTPKGGSATETIKPVLIVKKPEDYSANWKMLKEIITKDDQKTVKYKGKFKNRQPKGKMQKTNGAESSSKEVENQEAPMPEKEKLDIWFDNVDPILLEENASSQNADKPGAGEKDKKSTSKTLVTEDSYEGVTKVVAMDCEMVGVGMNGKDSILARVSIVNQHGKVLYDKFVKPTEEVVDYRTAVSGIRPRDLVNAYDFSVVQKEVADLIEGHILVGHALQNDLRTLYLSHPHSHIRDTSKYRGFKSLFGGRTPSLKKLVDKLLGIQIQQGEHNSIQDAQAAMRIYIMHRREWENVRPNKYKKRYLMKKNMASPKSKEQSSEVLRGN